ncbi:heptaprenylglyceryl phosphate synthase [Ammoniphilus sp. CFH 90114]|uniref:heptaprenylglyceryl phosphate synthase n=1 Tax=Ammoniphilus sp. CFH 90114 TaxID=2493665 RepID=UPI00100EC951|nr:heptaprenylglyceryl phosphate synthase [Ammoniphilus sp. CFH 90114]RXT04947.1 heptaprenylglyceryl phosphate synthase [Ammoniphilus sp. CFH 90114]
MINMKEWRHVFKLDPEKEISDENLEKICESGTDAIIVGGTQGVSYDNTIDLLARVRRYLIPCILEVSNVEAVVPGFDYYLLPLVLNADKKEWIFGKHIEGLMEYGALVKWSEVAVEGYIILNPQAEAARLTGAITDLDKDEIKAYARLADQMLKLPVLYLEYSGAYGDPEVVKEVKSVTHDAQLFYGGGIRTLEQAKEMADWADTVVIGNILYEDIKLALQTVASVKDVIK